MQRLLRIITTLLLLAGMASCGGGNGGPFGPTDLALRSGIYEGNVQYKSLGQQDRMVRAVIALLPNGELRYWSSDCVLMAGTLDRSASQASGALLALAPVSCSGHSTLGTFPDGSESGVVAASLSFGDGILTGTFNGVGMAGTAQLSYDSALTSRGAQLSRVAGLYALPGDPSGGPQLSIDSLGNISGEDAEGTFTGQISIVDPALNVYRLTLVYSAIANDNSVMSVELVGNAILIDRPDGTVNGRLLLSVNSPLPDPSPIGLTLPLDKL